MTDKPASTIKGYLSPSGAFHTPRDFQELANYIDPDNSESRKEWLSKFEPVILMFDSQVTCDQVPQLPPGALKAGLGYEQEEVGFYITDARGMVVVSSDTPPTAAQMDDINSRLAADPQTPALSGEPEVIYMLRNTALNTPWRDADKAAFDSASGLVEYERRELVDRAHVARLQAEVERNEAFVRGQRKSLDICAEQIERLQTELSAVQFNLSKTDKLYLGAVEQNDSLRAQLETASNFNREQGEDVTRLQAEVERLRLVVSEGTAWGEQKRIEAIDSAERNLELKDRNAELEGLLRDVQPTIKAVADDEGMADFKEAESLLVRIDAALAEGANS